MINADQARSLLSGADARIIEMWQMWLEDSILLVDDAIQECAEHGISQLTITIGRKMDDTGYYFVYGDFDPEMKLYDTSGELVIYNPAEYTDTAEFVPMLDLIGEMLEGDGFIIEEQVSKPSWRERVFGGCQESTSRILDNGDWHHMIVNW